MSILKRYQIWEFKRHWFEHGCLLRSPRKGKAGNGLNIPLFFYQIATGTRSNRNRNNQRNCGNRTNTVEITSASQHIIQDKLKYNCLNLYMLLRRSTDYQSEEWNTKEIEKHNKIPTMENIEPIQGKLFLSNI